MEINVRLMAIGLFSFVFSACSYNPFLTDNHITGNPAGAVVGAGVGAGGVALLGGSRPLITLAGLGGGMFGYYVTTLRYDSGGLIQSGGQVYIVGDFVGINIPADKLFEPNTANFLPQANLILDSAVVVLKRYPKNSIFISGNTSGFSRPRWELKLSEKRAQKVAAYFWKAGINQFQDPGNTMRDLNYVGYGNYVRIANTLTNKGIRQNNRIQITSFPSNCNLELGKKDIAMRNFGASVDDEVAAAPLCQNGDSSGDGINC